MGIRGGSGSPGPAGPPGAAGAPGTPGQTLGNFLSDYVGVTHTSNLSVVVSAGSYVIANAPYTSPQTTLTFGTADPTNPRIDVIALNTSGAAVIVEGVAAATPFEPVLDPQTQLRLTAFTIGAGATALTVTSTTIYTEGGGESWTESASGAPMTVNSTSSPITGAVSCEATAAVNGNYFQFANGSDFDTTTRNTLPFTIKSKGTWPNQKSLVFQWYDGTIARGSPVALRTGVYGFNSANTTTAQSLVIPLQAFGVAGLAVDTLRVTVTGGGGSIGFWLDDIYMQAGVAQSQPANAMVYRGAYSADVQYVLNDVVTYNGALYIARQSLIGVVPTGTGWVALVAGSSLTATYVGYGSGSNLVTGEAAFTYDAAANTVTAGKAVLGEATSLLLGTAGTAVGSVGFRNATSGTITMQPTTGALGTVTLTLPAVTGTMYSTGNVGTNVATALAATTNTGAGAFVTQGASGTGGAIPWSGGTGLTVEFSSASALGWNSGTSTFSTVNISASGTLAAVGITSSSGSVTSIHATADVAGGHGTRVTNSNTGTAAYAVVEARNDAPGTGSIIVRGTGYTTNGLLVANGVEIIANATGGPLLIRQQQAQPMIFAVAGFATTDEALRILGAAGSGSIARNIGVQTTNPTAYLHIKAGSATAGTAPLKLTSGTNNTTAEAGAFEYNGTNLFFTRSGTTRENVITTSAVNSVSATLPNRTLTTVIDGTTYYIHAKTTND